MVGMSTPNVVMVQYWKNYEYQNYPLSREKSEILNFYVFT